MKRKVADNTNVISEGGRAGFSPGEFGTKFGLSRSAVYAGIDRGEIKAVRIGHRIVIPATEVDRLLSPGDEPDAA